MQLQFTTKDIERFWSQVDASGDCWLWTGGLWSKGYGRFCCNSRTYRSHRVSYQILVGDIPDALELDHLCRVPLCVNPDHLQVVTTRDNVLRGYSFSARNKRATHCHVGHPFDNANTTIRRNGWRECHACRLISKRNLRRRRKGSAITHAPPSALFTHTIDSPYSLTEDERR